MSNSLAEQIAVSMRTMGQTVDTYFNELTDKSPAAGSPASVAHDSKYGRAEEGAALDLVEQEIWLTIGIPSDHLQAAYRLMVTGENVGVQRYAVLSVLRVALEVSSLAWWLTDPRIGVKQRVTRGLRLAESSRQRRENADRLIAKGSEDLKHTKAMEELIGDLARQLKIQAIVSRLNDDRQVNIPDAVDLVRQQFGAIPNADADSAVSVYSVLSEPMHGNFFGSAAGYRRSMPQDATRELHPDVRVFEIAIGANYATFALTFACKAFIQWMGWDGDRWDDLTHDSLGQISAAVEIARAIPLTP